VIDHGAATDVGLVRTTNEDSYLDCPPVFVVADGMGGHDGGDVASRIVVEEFEQLADRMLDLAGATSAVHDVLGAAQERITGYAAQMREQGAADFVSGTTCVAAMVVDAPAGPEWLLVNVGDSRLYQLSSGELAQLSIDHSVVQEMVDSGRLTPDEAARHPERNVVTRALGGVAPSEPDLFHVSLPPGTRLLLCSDGVSGMIADDHIARILAADTDARETAERLVAAALEAGGRDNATAIVVDVVGLADENPDDSAQQGASLEQKLGVLP